MVERWSIAFSTYTLVILSPVVRVHHRTARITGVVDYKCVEQLNSFSCYFNRCKIHPLDFWPDLCVSMYTWFTMKHDIMKFNFSDVLTASVVLFSIEADTTFYV